jgi:hypothetical protein
MVNKCFEPVIGCLRMMSIVERCFNLNIEMHVTGLSRLNAMRTV